MHRFLICTCVEAPLSFVQNIMFVFPLGLSSKSWREEAAIKSGGRAHSPMQVSIRSTVMRRNLYIFLAKAWRNCGTDPFWSSSFGTIRGIRSSWTPQWWLDRGPCGTHLSPCLCPRDWADWVSIKIYRVL